MRLTSTLAAAPFAWVISPLFQAVQTRALWREDFAECRKRREGASLRSQHLSREHEFVSGITGSWQLCCLMYSSNFTMLFLKAEHNKEKKRALVSHCTNYLNFLVFLISLFFKDRYLSKLNFFPLLTMLCSDTLWAAVVPMPLAVILCCRSWPPVLCLQDTAMWREHILK